MKLAALVFGAIPMLVQYYATKYIEQDKASTLKELENDDGLPRITTYDFIVVGGGSAGSLMAGRLSEKFKVLLLEAGGSPVPQSNVIMFAGGVALNPDTNYFYKSIPQRNMSLSTGGIVSLETGKMLGGSGSHNEMVHQRGNPKDWDNYALLTGDPSWSYANVLQYFKKSENFIGHLLQPDQSEYYGRDGPLTVDTHIPQIFPLWSKAGEELGFPTADPNAQQIPSFSPMNVLIEKGRRVSTYNRYVLPFEGERENLTVIRYATVNKVLLTNATIPQAYGVTYLRHGIPQIAHASKEVILSAGSINSPLLLMMSGIGPREVLDNAQIPLRVSSPSVGRNLDDHVWLPFPVGAFSFNASVQQHVPRIREDEFEEELKRYFETGEGPFGKSQEGQQALFASTRAVREGQGDWPDARIIFDDVCPMSMEDGVDTQLCFHMDLNRAKSKGSVTLNASAYLAGETDFVKLATIDFNGLSVESDLEVMLEGIELIMKVIEGTEVFSSLGAKYVGEALPACAQHLHLSRDYWACYIQQKATTAIHMVGTCGMGALAGSVSDSKLRVRGVGKLRVVDASVLPITPNANLNAPVILVAEKAAAEILQEYSTTQQ